MPAETVAAALEKIAALWGLPAGTEVTLEASPTSADAARFAAFARAGVNRLSIGVQAVDDAALKFTGRAPCAAEALAPMWLTGRTLPPYSLDPISARAVTSQPNSRAHIGTT